MKVYADWWDKLIFTEEGFHKEVDRRAHDDMENWLSQVITLEEMYYMLPADKQEELWEKCREAYLRDNPFDEVEI